MAIRRLLARFGFVQIERYGLVVTPEDRILSTRHAVLDDGIGGRIVGWRDTDPAAVGLDCWQLTAPVRPVAVIALPPPPKVAQMMAAVAEPIEEVEAEAIGEVIGEDDDWEWQIAAARARADADLESTAVTPPIVVEPVAAMPAPAMAPIAKPVVAPPVVAPPVAAPPVAAVAARSPMRTPTKPPPLPARPIAKPTLPPMSVKPMSTVAPPIAKPASTIAPPIAKPAPLAPLAPMIAPPMLAKPLATPLPKPAMIAAETKVRSVTTVRSPVAARKTHDTPAPLPRAPLAPSQAPRASGVAPRPSSAPRTSSKHEETIRTFAAPPANDDQTHTDIAIAPPKPAGTSTGRRAAARQP